MSDSAGHAALLARRQEAGAGLIERPEPHALQSVAGRVIPVSRINPTALRAVKQSGCCDREISEIRGIRVLWAYEIREIRVPWSL